MRRFVKGDKVLGSWFSMALPLAEVEEVYEAAGGEQVLLISYIVPRCVRSELLRAESAVYVGERKFLAVGERVYRVSIGKAAVDAESEDMATIIADFLETFTPPFPGETEPDSPVAHDDWRSLNASDRGVLSGPFRSR